VNSELYLAALVVQEAQMGLMVLDSNENIVLFNEWLVKAACLPEKDAIGKNLLQLFPELQGTRLQSAVETSLQKGFPSLLSQSLNRTPFPIYAGAEEHKTGIRMEQLIHVIPLKGGGITRQRHCIIQIANVSEAVRREKILIEQAKELRRNLITDGLTGIYSRRYWEEQTLIEFRKARRDCSPVAMMMLDVDLFKHFNDTYGHPEGDLCLQRVARAAANELKRPRDILARYGGEEFVALLPETNLEGAAVVSERIVKAIQNLQIPHLKSNVAPYVTLSIGVACGFPVGGDTQETIISEADQALYAAKHLGRNRVVLRKDEFFFTTGNIKITSGIL